jgi:adenylate cyclase
MDFEAEGLLEGLEGEDRDSRLALLEWLSADGVSDAELRKAVSEQRLALLPVERALGGDSHLSAAEVAEQADIPVDFLRRQRRALGLPQADEDEAAFSDEDVDAAKDMKRFLDAGLDQEGVEDVTRVIGEGMSRVARAVAQLTAESLLRPGVSENDIGQGYAAAARGLGPLLGKQLEYVFKLQLRELVRNDIVSRAELESGKLPGSETISVSFSDLVGFTKLGEQLPPEELGRVAGRLGKLAGDVAEPPVRLVKTIGDAAMLVSPDPEALVRVTLALVEATSPSYAAAWRGARRSAAAAIGTGGR